jgi:hypothetical protein
MESRNRDARKDGGMMPALRKYRPSVWFLIGANLIPVLGVIVWGWSVFLVMFLYWLENVILGLINVLKTIFDLKLHLREREKNAGD